MGWSDLNPLNIVRGADQSAKEGIRGAWNTITAGPEMTEEELRRKKLLEEQAAAAGVFADYGQGGFVQTGREGEQARGALRDIASGKVSHSAEQLRQGAQQNQSQQQSVAAAASPSNSAMAARTAAMNMGRIGSGLSGQTAIAGIAERQGAAKALNDAIAAARAQELEAALGSRRNAMTGYGAGMPFGMDKSWMEKYGSAITGVAGLAFQGGPKK